MLNRSDRLTRTCIASALLECPAVAASSSQSRGKHRTFALAERQPPRRNIERDSQLLDGADHWVALALFYQENACAGCRPQSRYPGGSTGELRVYQSLGHQSPFVAMWPNRGVRLGRVIWDRRAQPAMPKAKCSLVPVRKPRRETQSATAESLKSRAAARDVRLRRESLPRC